MYSDPFANVAVTLLGIVLILVSWREEESHSEYRPVVNPRDGNLGPCAAGSQ